MDDEVTIAAGGGSYAAPGDLTTADDLPELDMVVRRWVKDGAGLRIRIKALDLDQQEQIDLEAVRKHPKTGEWFRSNPAYCAATMLHGVIVPKLTKEQAQAMRQHNPAIVQSIVKWIWLLSALDSAVIEQYANDIANLDGAAAEPVVSDSGE